MTPEQGNVQPWRENVERVREALWRIRENAKSWHGPLRDTGHEKALAVIASWCDAATTVFDVLTTQIEELERELQIVNEANAAWGAVAGEFSVRAEKAEQERDEWREAARSQVSLAVEIDQEVVEQINTLTSQLRNARGAYDELYKSAEEAESCAEKAELFLGEMQEALEFYADEKTWTQMTSWGGRIVDDEGPWVNDCGARARAALRPSEDTSDEPPVYLNHPFRERASDES